MPTYQKGSLMMTVGDLRDVLDGVDDSIEVRLAHQPHWPFEYDVDTAAVTDAGERLDIVSGRPWDDESSPADGWWVFDPDDEDYEPDGPHETHLEAQHALALLMDEHQPVLYLAEGHQIGYLPTEARKAISW